MHDVRSGRLAAMQAESTSRAVASPDMSTSPMVVMALPLEAKAGGCASVVAGAVYSACPSALALQTSRRLAGSETRTAALKDDGALWNAAPSEALVSVDASGLAHAMGQVTPSMAASALATGT